MASNVVGVSVDACRISVCAMSSGGKQRCLSFACASAPATPEWEGEAAGLLRQAVLELQVKGTEAVIALGREYTLLKPVDLPRASHDKMVRLVSASGPGLVPAAGDGARFSYMRGLGKQLLDDGSLPVVIVVVKAGIVESVVRAARAAGLLVKSVQPAAAAELGAFGEVAPSAADSDGMVIVPGVDGASGQIVALQGGQFVSSLGYTEGRVAQAFKILRVVTEQAVSGSDHPVADRVFVIRGKGQPVVDLPGAELLHIPVESAAAYGAALMARGHLRFSAEFLSDGEVQDGRTRRKGLVVWVAAAVILLMASAWVSLATLNSDLDRQLSSARKDLRSLGAEARKLEKLQRERNSYASVGRKMELAGEQRPRILMAMGEIAKQSPRGLWVGEMSYDDKGSLTLKGGCQNEQALGDFLGALERSPIFARVSLDESTWSGQGSGNAVTFKASCVLNRVKLL